MCGVPLASLESEFMGRIFFQANPCRCESSGYACGTRLFYWEWSFEELFAGRQIASNWPIYVVVSGRIK